MTQPKTVYQLDAQNCYLHPTVADPDPMQPDNWLIPAGCVETAPPKTAASQVAQWQPESQTWRVVPDLRGQTVYRTDDGSPRQIDQAGELPDDLTVHPRPSPAHQWQPESQSWQLDPARAAVLAAEQLAQAKTAKLAALNADAQAYIDRAAGIDRLPRFEVDTWTLQALEAKAWAADNSAATPTLDTIAAARSIPPDILKQKALAKALAYEQLTATVVGLRQAIETRIKQAADMAELEAIEFAFGT